MPRLRHYVIAQMGYNAIALALVENLSRLAILLQDDGWYVRGEIIWHKPNPIPESVEEIRPLAVEP